MKLIREITEDVTVKPITEDVNGEQKKNVYIEGVFLQGNVKNRNGRIYNTDVLEREVNRYMKEKVQKGRAYGELDHPSGPGINMDRVSHIITELRRDGDNFYGKAKLASTPMGDIARGLISDGAQLGVSSRGMGSIKENRDGVMEVQDDFYLATPADIVADPSAPDAFVNGIMEGVEWVWQDGRLEAIAEQSKAEVEKAARRGSLTEEEQAAIFARFMNRLQNMPFSK